MHMGDGETTGLLTGVERETIERVRQACLDLSELLRESAATINDQLIPLNEEATLTEWVSSARISYDIGRSTIGTALGLVALACGYVAADYDDAVWLIDQQYRVEFL